MRKHKGKRNPTKSYRTTNGFSGPSHDGLFQQDAYSYRCGYHRERKNERSGLAFTWGIPSRREVSARKEFEMMRTVAASKQALDGSCNAVYPEVRQNTTSCHLAFGFAYHRNSFAN